MRTLLRGARRTAALARIARAPAASRQIGRQRDRRDRRVRGAGDRLVAVDELLDLFRRDRDWNDGAAKAQLFTIFDALKPQDPIALNGRRKLSSLIFA